MPIGKKPAQQESRQPSVTGKHLAAWARWEGSAARFQGLGARLHARQALRCIFPTKWGFQVRVHRGKFHLVRTVKGISHESLLEAIRIRDEALRKKPARNLHPVPPKVLRALGFSSPVPGIHRWEARSLYRVDYKDAAGRRRTKSFYYRQIPEEDAYAAAIAFLESALEEKICLTGS